MPIYTRTGDDGTTALFGGKRLSKADIQIEAYGTLDELTTVLGLFIAYIPDPTEIPFVEDIQRDLYSLMGFLANAPMKLDGQVKRIILFEKKIDSLTEKLPPLTNFILPKGSLPSCWAHMARVSCRKAERTIILFFKEAKKLQEPESQVIVKYINRLSDLLFTYARFFNNEKEMISKRK